MATLDDVVVVVVVFVCLLNLACTAFNAIKNVALRSGETLARSRSTV